MKLITSMLTKILSQEEPLKSPQVSERPQALGSRTQEPTNGHVRRPRITINDRITLLNTNQIIKTQLQQLWKKSNSRRNAGQEDCRTQAIELSHSLIKRQVKTDSDKSLKGVI